MQGGQEDLDDQDPHQPGDEIGLFSVTGKLGPDSCGAENLSAPAKWSFQLKLSRKGSTLYWLNGREAIVGEIDKNGRFSFETQLEVPLAPQRGAAKGCTMFRRDVASGTLASGEASFTGKLSYAYDQSSGSDCSEFTTGVEGQPLALPCSFSYALAGTRAD